MWRFSRIQSADRPRYTFAGGEAMRTRRPRTIRAARAAASAEVSGTSRLDGCVDALIPDSRVELQRTRQPNVDATPRRHGPGTRSKKRSAIGPPLPDQLVHPVGPPDRRTRRGRRRPPASGPGGLPSMKTRNQSGASGAAGPMTRCTSRVWNRVAIRTLGWFRSAVSSSTVQSP